MKIYNLLIIGVLIGLGLSSCVNEADVPNPKADFEVYWEYKDAANQTIRQKLEYTAGGDTIIVYKNEQLVFNNLSQGTHFSIWTGDAGFNYDVLANIGSYFPAPASGNTFLKKYTANGNFTLYVFASSATENGITVAKDKKTAIIRVVDKP
jgi:hypothetical protein